MTTQEAIATWHDLRATVTYASLQAEAKHRLVHEVFEAINRARLSGELTIEQIEAL